MEYVCLHLGCDPLWEMGSWFREVVYLERLLTNLRLLMVERFQQKTMPDKIAVDHASRCDTQATPLCDCSRGHAWRLGDGEIETGFSLVGFDIVVHAEGHNSSEFRCDKLCTHRGVVFQPSPHNV